MSNEDKYQHNKGQTDRSGGKYDPPHSRIEDTANHWIGGEPKSDRSEKDSYDRGWSHTDRQK
jgi:hypothetical protein